MGATKTTKRPRKQSRVAEARTPRASSKGGRAAASTPHRTAAEPAARTPRKAAASPKSAPKAPRPVRSSTPPAAKSAPPKQSSATAKRPTTTAHKPAPQAHGVEPRRPVKKLPQPVAVAVEKVVVPVPGSADANRPRLSRHELVDLRHALVSERARLTGVVEGLREQSLLRHDEVNHEEDGTDAFIRLFDLDRASNEQSQIVKIDSAIRAIDEGVYGLCEKCGCRIEKPRLQALPFVKTCIKCQSEAEGGHRGRVSARHRLWE